MALILQPGAFLKINYTNTLVQILQAQDSGDSIFSTGNVPPEFQTFCEEKGVSLEVTARVTARDTSARKISPIVTKNWEIEPYDEVREKSENNRSNYFVLQTSAALAYIQDMTKKENQFKWVLLDDLELIPVQGGFRNEGEAP